LEFYFLSLVDLQNYSRHIQGLEEEKVKVRAKHTITIWVGETKYELQSGEVLEVPDQVGVRLLASGKLSKYLEEVP
jgi:hypothetical protein